MKVLFIHMTGAFGGSSRSLMEAVRALSGKVEAHFVTPRGSVVPYFRELGDVIAVRGLTQFDNTKYSYYRGTRWSVLIRELFNIPFTIAAIRQARRQWPDIDLVHVNEFTGVFPMWLAERLFDVPIVVHVRSVARNDVTSWRTKVINGLLRRHATAIVAIDETVRQSLPEELEVDVIHNAFTPKAEKVPDESFSRAIGELRSSSLKLGFVGNLLKVKGILDLVEAANIVKRRNLDVEYVIVGDDARSSVTLRAKLLGLLGLNQNVGKEVESMIRAYGLQNDVHMMGFMSDIAQAYRNMDVLCFPSHYNAPGRPVFEAAFSSVPSIVALTHPTADTLVDGTTGFAVPPHDPRSLAEAIATLSLDRALVKRMGLAAFDLAEANFSVERNALKLYAVFRRCLGYSEE